MIFLSRLIAALAYAGAAFLFGLSLGERGELGAVQYVFLLTIPVATLILTFFARDARPEVLLTGAALLLAVHLGQRSFRAAFDECVTRAATVDDAVRTWIAANGEYPITLEQLPGPLPCDCILRDTILHYTRNERSYRLWFTDGQVVHAATNRKRFTR